jgi:hypothetical protein
MSDQLLLSAQAARQERILDEFIDDRLDVVLSAADVGPEARAKLKNLLKYYAAQPHIYRTCVRDNMSRLGPGRTERTCATIKEMIRSTTRWNTSGFTGSQSPEMDEETETILLSIEDEDLEGLMGEVMARGQI